MACYLVIQQHCYRKLVLINNGLLVNSIPPAQPFQYIYIYVYTRAALRRVLNELCGPCACWSWPAMVSI